jgi:flagellar basal-body rod protein FlgF
MDRLIYIAMNGAKHTLERQATISHNLANLSTTGFKAQVAAFRALPVVGEGAKTRVFAVDSTVGSDFRQGPMAPTGRPLDVSVQGPGWIAVQGPNVREAYTRAGDLQVSANGLLQTRTGMNVVGEAGPITIPPNSDVSIGQDGTVSVVPTDNIPNTVNIVGRIKLVNPPEKDLERGSDGLFRLKSGLPAPADANVQLSPGALEGSNVSMVDALVDMISAARHYDAQIKLLQTAEATAQQWGQLINMAGA